MTIDDYLQFYLSAFYILGLSPYQPKVNAKMLIICKLSKFVQAFLCISITAICFYYLDFNGIPESMTVAETIIINIIVMCDLCRTMAIFVQCVLFKHCMNEIVCIFHNMDFYFKKYLHHRICYDSLSKTSRMKYGIMVGETILYICSFIIRYFFQDKASMIGLMLKILQLMSALTCVSIIFCIDLLNFFVTQLNWVIRRDTIRIASLLAIEINSESKCGRINFILTQLKYYKIIHFRLWMVNQRINKYYGYSLIAIILYGFFNLIHFGTWIFRHFFIITDYKFATWSMLRQNFPKI